MINQLDNICLGINGTGSAVTYSVCIGNWDGVALRKFCQPFSCVLDVGNWAENAEEPLAPN